MLQLLFCMLPENLNAEKIKFLYYIYIFLSTREIKTLAKVQNYVALQYYHDCMSAYFHSDAA